MNLALGIFVILIAGFAPLSLHAQDKPEKYADLPIGKADTGLTGAAASIALQKATAFVAATNPDCPSPTVRYSTVPLHKALTSKPLDIPEETEVWYLNCDRTVPVMIRYQQFADGRVEGIYVRPFSDFVKEIKFQRLSLRRNPDFDFDKYFDKVPPYEPLCFSRVADTAQKTLRQNVPRLKSTNEDQHLRAICIRMITCNSIEPDIDIIHDTILVGGSDNKNGVKLMGQFAQACGKMQQDVETLFSEEPEAAYGMSAALFLVRPFADQWQKNGEAPQ